MADVAAEIPRPRMVTVGGGSQDATRIHVRPGKIVTLDGHEITDFSLSGGGLRGKTGIESAQPVTQRASRRKGDEGRLYDDVIPTDPGSDLDWTTVKKIRFTDAGGHTFDVPSDTFELDSHATGPAPEAAPPAEPAPLPVSDQHLSGEVPAETAGSPAEAEKTVPAAEPTMPAPEQIPAETVPAPQTPQATDGQHDVISFIRLEGIEPRVQDLANKYFTKNITPREHAEFEGLRGVWEKVKDKFHVMVEVKRRVWKNMLRPYFEERLKQFYSKAVEVSQLPFADGSLKHAEAQASAKYQEYLDGIGPLRRGARKFIEYVKDNTGGRTMVQDLTLQELSRMRAAGEIEIFEAEKAAFGQASEAVRRRMELEFNQESDVIRSGLGEKLEILKPGNDTHKALVTDLKNLMKRRLDGELEDSEWERARDDFFRTKVAPLNPQLFQEVRLYASSLDSLVATMIMKRDHETGIFNLDSMMDNMEIRLGVAVMGEATQLEATATQRGVRMVKDVLDYLQKKNIISAGLVSDASLGTAVSAAIALGSVPVQFTGMFARSLAPLWAGGFAGAAVAGTMGGFKEYWKIRQEYLDFTRANERGEMTAMPKRREWMQKYLVSQRDARELAGTMLSSIHTPEGTVRDSLSDGELRAALANLADAKARKAISARSDKRIGLISFSGLDALETERTGLDAAALKLNADLKSYFVNHPDKSALLGGLEYDDYLTSLTAVQSTVLTEGIRILESYEDPVKDVLSLTAEFAPEVAIIKRRFGIGKEKQIDAQGMNQLMDEFHKAAVSESAKYGAKRAVSGLVIGALTQEGVTDIANWARTGDFEFVGGIAQTVGRGRFELQKLMGTLPVGPLGDVEMIGDQNLVQLSGNMHIDDRTGHLLYTAQDGQNHVLSLDPGKELHYTDGVLDRESADMLTERARNHNLDIEFRSFQSTVDVANKPGDLHGLKFGEVEIQVPKELDWDTAPDGSRVLMLHDVQTRAGLVDLEISRSADPWQAYRDFSSRTDLFIPKEPAMVDILGDVPVDTHTAALPAYKDFSLSAEIPTGTELRLLQDDIYQLVSTADPQHPVLMPEIRISETGQILNADVLNQSNAAHDLGISFKSSHLQTINEITVGDGTVDYGKVTELPRFGGRGFWGYAEQVLKGNNYDHHNASINAVKNVFLGFKKQGEGYPELFFSQDGMSDIAKWADKAAKEYERLHLEHPNWNNHRILEHIREADGERFAIALKLGYYGRGAASPEDLDVLARALGAGESGGTSQPVELFQSTISQTLKNQVIGQSSQITYDFTDAPKLAGSVLSVYDHSIPGQLPIPIIPVGLPHIPGLNARKSPAPAEIFSSDKGSETSPQAEEPLPWLPPIAAPDRNDEESSVSAAPEPSLETNFQLNPELAALAKELGETNLGVTPEMSDYQAVSSPMPEAEGDKGQPPPPPPTTQALTDEDADESKTDEA